VISGASVAAVTVAAAVMIGRYYWQRFVLVGHMFLYCQIDDITSAQDDWAVKSFDG